MDRGPSASLPVDPVAEVYDELDRGEEFPGLHQFTAETAIDHHPVPGPIDPQDNGPRLPEWSEIERFLGGSVTILGNVVYEQVDVASETEPINPREAEPRP